MKRFVQFFSHPPYAIAVGPFQFVLMVIAGIQGVQLLATPHNPSGILQQTYPRWMIVLWGVCLLGGCACALVGRLRRNGWREEAIGLWVIGFTLFWYVLTVALLHSEALAQNVVNLLYVYACYVRIRVLRLAHTAEREARRRGD